MPEVQVTMVFTAKVPADYGPHEIADAIRFHVDLSELDSIEADISAIDITDAREVSERTTILAFLEWRNDPHGPIPVVERTVDRYLREGV